MKLDVSKLPWTAKVQIWLRCGAWWRWLQEVEGAV